MEDNEGWNALDIAIIKMNYEVALLLKKLGLTPRDKDLYIPHLWTKYDVELLIQYLAEGREEI